MKTMERIINETKEEVFGKEILVTYLDIYNKLKTLQKEFKTKIWVVDAIGKDMNKTTGDEFDTLFIRQQSVMNEANEVLDEMRNIRVEAGYE